MLQLPLPAEGGSIEALAPFWNYPEPRRLRVVISWVLAGLRHGGPYHPILALGRAGVGQDGALENASGPD